jgi:uncharacterized protein DUF1998
VEQFGEGFFLQFAPEALAHWLSQPDVLKRAKQLQAGSTAWVNAKRARGILVSEHSFRERERPEYVMAHSLAHALMGEVAIDCGYPASSLKERIYVLPRAPGQPIQCGILIYTATAGNQGTLGGLVEVTRRFVRILKSALERERLCSGDPVCADQDPSTADDDRTLHGAACHGCLLVAETSCEARNLFLDRALIVDTVGQTGAGFFLQAGAEADIRRIRRASKSIMARSSSTPRATCCAGATPKLGTMATWPGSRSGRRRWKKLSYCRSAGDSPHAASNADECVTNVIAFIKEARHRA